MKPSEVYFTNLRTWPGVNLLDKLENLIRKAGIGELDCKDKFTVIKLHFGEPGNMAYLRPGYVNRVVEVLQGLGAKVFLAESTGAFGGMATAAFVSAVAQFGDGVNFLADGFGREVREIACKDSPTIYDGWVVLNPEKLKSFFSTM